MPQYCMPDPTAALTDEIIREDVAHGSRVIDFGCGDGRLLQMLRDEHGCAVQGVELDLTQMLGCIRRGVSVLRLDLDDDLSLMPDESFDTAVLSQTLQQVRHPKKLLSEMLRIARRALVVVPNFGHWRVRVQVLRYGSTPVTDSLPYHWYETPNLHFMSIPDFRGLAHELNLRIVQERPIIRGRAVDRAWWANLRAESVFYVLERNA